MSNTLYDYIKANSVYVDDTTVEEILALTTKTCTFKSQGHPNLQLHTSYGYSSTNVSFAV